MKKIAAAAGIIVGLRYVFRRSLSVEARWSQGFVPAVTDADDSAFHHHNRALRILAGMEF